MYFINDGYYLQKKITFTLNFSFKYASQELKIIKLIC